jgi:hypothetical protein
MWALMLSSAREGVTYCLRTKKMPDTATVSKPDRRPRMGSPGSDVSVGLHVEQRMGVAGPGGGTRGTGGVAGARMGEGGVTWWWV